MLVTNHFLQRHWHCFVNSYFLNYFRNIFFCLRFINDLIVKLIHKRCVVSLNKSHCRFRKFAVLIFASIAIYARIFIHYYFDFRRSSFMRSSKLKNSQMVVILGIHPEGSKPIDREHCLNVK